MHKPDGILIWDLPLRLFHWLLVLAVSMAAAAAGTVLAILVPAAAALMRLPPAGIGAVVADASWKEECGSCHMAFPPSLLPAESWRGLMATLADHFGEDASLEAEQAAGIMAYLVANSAETQDSLPANRFRRIDGLRPFEITATPFWKRMHGDIPPSVFASKPVGAKQNCAACHADAQTAMFAPQKISIPQETKP